MAYGGKQTLYDVLGLTRDASAREVEHAYRRLSGEIRREHAAPNPRRDALLHEAFDVLSDPHRRAAYDKSLRGGRFFGASGRSGPRRPWLLALAAIVAVVGAVAYFMLGSGGGRPQGPALSAQEIHTAASVAVGRVSRVAMSGARSALGVAVAVEEGVMLTVCRDIAPGTQILVRIPPRDIPAQVASADPATGLCKLAVSGGASWPLPLSPQPPRVGERVYAVNLGPLGEAVVSPGEVKRLRAVPGGQVIDSTARAGDPLDGSPLLDAQGRVIAVAIHGAHTTLPSGLVAAQPLAAPPAAARRTPPKPARPAPSEAPEVPAEKREKLEKAFRPPPTLPDL